MTTPDELLPLVDHILKLVGEDGAALERWSQTADGQKVIQYVVQIGKYNTNVGEGKDIVIGDRPAASVQGDWVGGDKISGDKVAGNKIIVEGDDLSRAVLEEIRDLLRSQIAPPPPEIDWQQASRSLLNEQIQRLTTNPLTHAEGIAYRTEQVYVPLGLVERKKVSRRRDDVSPEQGSLLYEETEITQKFEQGAFLEQVLRLGHSPKSQGKRIAVIGEPGAGKTTLLQQMARWVAENIEGAVAIWVSLADLQGRSLEDYLLEQWLPAAVQQQGQAEASTLVKDALVAQFRAGRVWLWLDGVDEMSVAAGNPLGEMERQVRLGGLLGQARMVLTCRLNLWDGDRQALETFDTYRTLEFAYPGQVEQFVGQWFGALPEGPGGQAERLCEALRQSGKERLRDLVKNPLRLTLLCFNWYLGEGTLPETKAGLYEQFVADFYQQKWNKEPISTTAEQRRRLNAALGELAREAIDKEETRFRLRHDFVCEFLGDLDEPDSLFQMALRLGWLNQIGVDAENRRKAVYAFFHPTFQEYFAALAIDDWHFFLNHIPDNPDHVNASYRVFNPQWKEVFLLWLGRNNLSIDSKKDLIQALVKFEDLCRSFYWEKAILLVAEAIAEFDDPTYAKKIVEQLVIWSFGCFDKNEWKNSLSPLTEAAKLALIRTNRHLAILEVIDFIQYFPEDFYARYRAIQILGELGSENLRIIEYLENLLESSQDKWSILQISESLLKIKSSHKKAASTIFLSFEDEDIFVAKAAVKIIEGLKSEKPPIQNLINLVLRHSSGSKEDNNSKKQEAPSIGSVAFAKITQDEAICGLAIQCLGSIGIGNDVAIYFLLDLLTQVDSEYLLCKTVESLGKIGINNPSVVSTLIKLLEVSQKLRLIGTITETLSMFPNSSEVVDALIKLLKNYRYIHHTNLQRANKSLSKIMVVHLERLEEIIDILSEVILNEKHPYINSSIFEFLGETAFENRKAIHILTQETFITESDNTRYFIAKNLAKIDPGNRDAISVLEDLLNTSGEYDWQGCIAAIELGKILPNHQKALDYLLDAILCRKMSLQPRYANEEFLRSMIIAQPDEVKWLTSFLDSSQGMQPTIRVVSELKKAFLNQQREHDSGYLEIYYEVLWYCTQHLPYQKFYKAWMDM